MEPSRYSDRELIDALRSDESWAAEEVGRRITPIIRHRLFTIEDWEDVRQYCLLQIIKAVRGTHHITNFWGLIHKVTVCHVINYNRHHRLRRKTFTNSGAEQENDASDPPDTAPRDDDRLADRSLLLYVYQRIDETCQRIFYMLFVEDRGYDDAAAELGMTTNNLRVRLSRCRARARALRAEAI